MIRLKALSLSRRVTVRLDRGRCLYREDLLSDWIEGTVSVSMEDLLSDWIEGAVSVSIEDLLSRWIEGAVSAEKSATVRLDAGTCAPLLECSCTVCSARV